MDWYRKKTWTNEDEEHFFAKLNSARKTSRAQFLKIQAIELIETKRTKHLDIAEALLNQMLIDYPEDKFNRSSALNSLGEIYEIRNDLETALSYYKKSIEFEKEYPNVQTESYLSYSELNIKLKNTDKYEEIQRLLEPKLEESIFPIQKYKISSILSIIYNHIGEVEMVKKYQIIAAENANSETSGLRYHKYLGIVEKRIGWLDKLVKRK